MAYDVKGNPVLNDTVQPLSPNRPTILRKGRVPFHGYKLTNSGWDLESLEFGELSPLSQQLILRRITPWKKNPVISLEKIDISQDENRDPRVEYHIMNYDTAKDWNPDIYRETIPLRWLDLNQGTGNHGDTEKFLWQLQPPLILLPRQIPPAPQNLPVPQIPSAPPPIPLPQQIPSAPPLPPQIPPPQQLLPNDPPPAYEELDVLAQKSSSAVGGIYRKHRTSRKHRKHSTCRKHRTHSTRRKHRKHRKHRTRRH